MTDQQQKWIAQLSTCAFYPGSWEKRFVRDLATFPPEQELTEKQAAALHRTAWHYRVQRGEPHMEKPNDPLLIGDKDAITKATEALRAWNAGEKIK